jgi:hypothetical protein
MDRVMDFPLNRVLCENPFETVNGEVLGDWAFLAEVASFAEVGDALPVSFEEVTLVQLVVE